MRHGARRRGGGASSAAAHASANVLRVTKRTPPAPYCQGAVLYPGMHWERGACDIPSGCCFFMGPWTVTRSSLRVLRRVAAFCRPLRPVFLVVSFPRSRSAAVRVPGVVLVVAGGCLTVSAAQSPARSGRPPPHVSLRLRVREAQSLQTLSARCPGHPPPASPRCHVREAPSPHLCAWRTWALHAPS